jgi:hypothetical protein
MIRLGATQRGYASVAEFTLSGVRPLKSHFARGTENPCHGLLLKVANVSVSIAFERSKYSDVVNRLKGFEVLVELAPTHVAILRLKNTMAELSARG